MPFAVMVFADCELPGRADVGDRHPAHPALCNAAGRIADALRSVRRPERKLGASRDSQSAF